MTTSWVLREGDTDLQEIDFRAAVNIASDSSADVVWIEVTPDELVDLVPRLGFHHQAIEDAVKAADGLSEAAQRTKLDRFDTHVFLYLFMASLDPDSGELSLSEIPAFVSPKFVVVVDRARPYDFDILLARWRESPSLLKFGVPTLLYGLIDLVIDSHLETVDLLAEAVDEMEDDLFNFSSE